MYSTCCSVELAGYWDFSFLAGRDVPLRWGVCLVDEGVDGVLDLVVDPRRGMR